MRRSRLILGAVCVLALLETLGAQNAPAAKPVPPGDWPMYRHDYAGTGRSPLTQITTGNVAKLPQPGPTGCRATARRSEFARRRRSSIGGVMYLPAADRVVALDPETGEGDVALQSSPAARLRGAASAYWPGEGATPPRIIFTAGRRLIALDAKTGALDRRLRHERRSRHGACRTTRCRSSTRTSSSSARTRRRAPSAGSAIRARSTRAPARSCGSSAPCRSRARSGTTRGKATAGRAASASTPGRSTSRSTSSADSSTCRWRRRSPAPTAATARAPTCSAIPSSPWMSQTGKYKWHFQTIHHDLWDADPPAPPALFDVVRNGRTDPGAGADDEIGLPVHPESRNRPADLRRRGAPGREERRARRAGISHAAVPGEAAAAGARHVSQPEDLVTAADTTPEHAAACRNWSRRSAASTTPGRSRRGRYRAEARRRRARWCFPGGLGGANWGGTAFDPTTGYVFVATQDVGALGWMETTKAGWLARPVRQERTGPGRGTLRRPDRRGRALAVPETAMGPADRGQCRRPATSRGRCRSASPSNFPRASRTPDGPRWPGRS